MHEPILDTLIIRCKVLIFLYHLGSTSSEVDGDMGSRKFNPPGHPTLSLRSLAYLMIGSLLNGGE